MTVFNGLNMGENVKIWLLTWASVFVSFADVIDVLRIAVLVVSFVYSFIRLWDYINKRRKN